MAKKKIPKEDIEKEIEYNKQLERLDAMATEIKDRFYYKIMEIYNITYIPTPYVLRVNDVILGKYKGMKTMTCMCRRRG